MAITKQSGISWLNSDPAPDYPFPPPPPRIYVRGCAAGLVDSSIQ
ncbi:hypothetical protein CB1_001178005, partial [Camelus ferus]